MTKRLKSIHPGEMLKEEFLKPLKISEYRLAKNISVPPRRINEIVHGKRAITADTALRLGKFFGNSPKFWLNSQAHYDLEVQEDLLADQLEHQVHAWQFAAKIGIIKT
ncbi:MAG: HigA family addiction module antitoxin [Candidatus Peregrinibacteria bacterium]